MNMPVRISPLSADERDDVAEELLSGVRTPGGEDLNIFATLARHPRLLRRWLPFGGALLYRGVLDGRHREILILRTAWRCRATYEWRHHVDVANEVGMTPEEINAITAEDFDGYSWTETERALLRAADELHDTATIGDQLWTTLAESFDERALIELCMLVGHYHMVAFTLNALGVQPENGSGRSAGEAVPQL